MTVTFVRPETIPELMQERRELAAQVQALTAKLEQVDKALFGKIESVVAAFGMHMPPVATQQFLFQPTVSPPLPSSPPLPPPPPRPVTVTVKPANSRRSSEVGWKIHENVTAMLKQHGKPMMIRDILGMLDLLGVEVPGKVPLNNLAAHLSRSKEFIRTGNGWWLAEKEVPTTGGT